MLKESIKIGKDYFKLISIKNKYLILFIICYIISMTINLIIPIFTSLIIEYITKDLYKETLKVISLLSISYLLHELFSYGIYHYYAIFFKNTYINIHQRIINSIYQLDEEFGKKLSSGKIINSSNIDIINISEISSDIFDIIIGLIKLIIILCIFLKQNIFLGIYILIINTIYTYYSYSCNKKSANHSKKQRKYADELTSLTSQVLTGLKDVKSYNMGEKLNKRFKDFRKNWGKNYYLKRKYYFTQKTLITLIIKFGKIILYAFLLKLVKEKIITLTIFLVLISYYEKFKTTIEEVMNYNRSLIEKSISMYRIIEIINYKKETKDKKRNQNIKCREGTIEFKKVYFKYENKNILENVSFIAKKNQITAIIGETGAGKTTILNLLLGFYKIDKGEITVDKNNLYDYEIENRNKIITVVNQKTFLFNMSIKENLSLINEDEKKQIETCKKVGIHDFIMTLPEKYNTILKENTINLSGGQKQLLTLARALLTPAKIILLDEVTSSLDPKTTKNIIKLLQELKKEYTIIIVTHNKEIMKNMDNLILLKNGRIKSICNYKE